MSQQTIKNAIESLDKARTATIVLKEFLKQWEQMTNNQLTGVDDTLNEIVEDISKAIVSISVEIGEQQINNQ